MLIEFRVKNFRSIKDEQTLSMVASNDDSLPENTFALTPKSPQSPKLPIHKMRFLKSAVIYGANASGKSNLLLAMRYVFLLLSYPGSEWQETGITRLAQPFLLDKNCRNAPTEITTVFTIGDEDIRYDLHIAVTSERVIEESLEYYPKGRVSTLYSRRYNSDKGKYDYDFPGGNFKGDKIGLKGKTRDTSLFLSIAAEFNHPELSQIRQWFGDARWPSHLPERWNTQAGLYGHYLSSRPNMAATLKEWLYTADIGIREYQFEHCEPPTEKQLVHGLKQPSMRFLHSGSGEDSFIELREESTGTQRWIDLFYWMALAMEKSGILLIDEMSADLHPLLMEHFFEIFNKTSFHTQLICTTHHSSLLGAKILRRDQVWFVEKDEVGASHYYSLLDFKPRKDEAYMKNYLAGSYGGIPAVSDPDEIVKLMSLRRPHEEENGE